ncbi:hypothetical protein, partial [Nocardia cyriacigeorgica]|uniref:hypothetical protein n=1 Tax=Nocardia cyriacigeorgica TaxID=135487 RepID=UPI001C49C61E
MKRGFVTETHVVVYCDGCGDGVEATAFELAATPGTDVDDGVDVVAGDLGVAHQLVSLSWMPHTVHTAGREERNSRAGTGKKWPASWQRAAARQPSHQTRS